MSFILDALKKSESDRQRQAHPETTYVPAATDDRRPSRWIWVVGTLLAANMLALMYVLLKPAAPALPAVTTVSEPARQDAADPVEMAQEPVPERVNNIPVKVPPTTAQPQVRETSPPPAAESAARTSETARTIKLPVEKAAAGTPEFKTFSEARIAGMQVDDLSLELHVYSSTPAERFVFINMGKYREGETLSEGPRVREIRPDGVLLDYSDMLFLLPRE